MDTYPRQNGLLYASFNQDCTCFSVGTEKGFFVCDTEPMKERFSREFNKGIGIVEMLYRCNILAMVGGGPNPKFPLNKVMLWDDFQAQIIAELEFSSPVKGVRIHRNRVVVILETKSYVHNFSDLKILDQIDTFYNPSGICAVCPSTDNQVMAFLGKDEGTILIKNYTQNTSRVIHAHDNAISQICLNVDGIRLATASTRGTLVRIFDTESGKQLLEFRRGSSPAAIESLSFNNRSTSLALSSDKGTIHIYSCANGKENRQSTFSFMSGMVPLFGSSWSSKQFSIPESRSICGFGDERDGKEIIYVLGGTGKYYKYTWTPEVECTAEVIGHYLNAPQ